MVHLNFGTSKGNCPPVWHDPDSLWSILWKSPLLLPLSLSVRNLRPGQTPHWDWPGPLGESTPQYADKRSRKNLSKRTQWGCLKRSKQVFNWRAYFQLFKCRQYYLWMIQAPCNCYLMVQIVITSTFTKDSLRKERKDIGNSNQLKLKQCCLRNWKLLPQIKLYYRDWFSPKQPTK